jgi:hypothetical protein
MTLEQWENLDLSVYDVWNLETPEDKEENRLEIYIVKEWDNE